MAENLYLGEIILINKPYQWTSFDVVNKLKSVFRHTLKVKTRIGHAGTLDPLATGLLVVCTGKYTKKIEEYQNAPKEYTGTFFLGATTPSFDLETEVDATFPVTHLTPEAIREAAEKFTGPILQVPPLYSAIKIKGERAYKKARRGEQAEIRAREVHIFSFEITDIQLPEVSFRLQCSKGTYVRSLARDFGAELKSGAYLSSLIRTRIGDFILEEALTPDEFRIRMDEKNRLNNIL